MKPKPFSEHPQTLGEHLKKRRHELRLFQREAAKLLSIDHFTYINWEKGKTLPRTHAFAPIIRFLGYDPSPSPQTMGERIVAKRRELGLTRKQLARHFGWDEGTLWRYETGIWPLEGKRRVRIEAFLRLRQFE